MVKNTYPANITSLINKFRHEVICRHESNQYQAKRIWLYLKPLLMDEDQEEISIDWAHYINGSLSIEKFGEVLKKLSIKYD